MRKLALSLVFVLCAASSHAYTLLDHEQISDTRPRWLRASVVPGDPAQDLFYMLQWRPDRSMEVRFVNIAAQDIHFHFQFEQLQPWKSGPNARVSVPAGKSVSLPLAIARLDQRSWLAPLRVWNIARGEDTFASTLPETGRPATLDREFEPVAASDKSEQAFFSYPTHDSIGYNPQVLPYFIMRKADKTAEVHFRNLAHHSLHFEFRILHYQDGMSVQNPRVRLRPMEDMEVLVPCERMDDHIPFGMVEVFNIRAGEDRGDFLVTANGGVATERLTKPHDWNFIGSDVFGHEFNAWGLGQRVLRGNGKVSGVFFRNLGATPVHFDFSLPQFQNVMTAKNPRASVLPGKELWIPLDLDDKLAGRAATVTPLVFNVRVGRDEGPFAGTPSTELVPRFAARDGWLFVTPIEDVLRFNPRAIEYQVKPTPEGADVAVRNLSDKTLFFDWSLSGYQSPTQSNVRVELPPAQERTLKAVLAKKDLRVALARLVVSNIRIDKDEGSLIAERK